MLPAILSPFSLSFGAISRSGRARRPALAMLGLSVALSFGCSGTGSDNPADAGGANTGGTNTGGTNTGGTSTGGTSTGGTNTGGTSTGGTSTGGTSTGGSTATSGGL